MTSSGKIPIPWSERLGDVRRSVLPASLWIGALGVSLWLLGERQQELSFLGLACALDHEVTAPVDGVLAIVVVDLFEEVEHGQLLARFDESDVVARLATEEAELSRLRAELGAARVRAAALSHERTSEWSTDLLRFVADEAERRLEAMELSVKLEADRVERQRLEVRAERERPLVAEELRAPAVLEELELRLEEMDVRIEQREILLAELEAAVKAATSRRLAFERERTVEPAVDALISPLRVALDVQAARMGELEAERRRLVLRSPAAGQVSELLAAPGQTLVLGEPVLRVTDRAARQVVAWLPEHAARSLAPEMIVVVRSLALEQAARRAQPFALARGRADDGSETSEARGRPDDGTAGILSVVASVAPSVEALPARLWRDPGVPEHGRAVLIEGVLALGLLPGERVGVRLAE